MPKLGTDHNRPRQPKPKNRSDSTTTTQPAPKPHPVASKHSTRKAPNPPAAPPKKQKSIVSTAAMVNRPPRLTAIPKLTPKHAITAHARGAITKPAHKSPGPSILKKARIAGESLAARHPLAVAFNETTQTYLSHTLSSLTTILRATHERHLATLTAAVSEPSSPADPTEPVTPQQPLAARYTAAVEALTTPLGAVTLRSELWSKDYTLQERLAAFRETLEAEVREVREMEEEYEGLLGELYWVLVAVLGEEEAGVVSGMGANGEDEEGKAVAPSMLEALNPAPQLEEKEVKGLRSAIEEVERTAVKKFEAQEKELRKKFKRQEQKIAQTMKAQLD